MLINHPSNSHHSPSVAIVGGGPAGLMAAEVIAAAGYTVNLYDAMPSVGRKFLLAGVGGMNITHAEPLDDFLLRYGDALDWLEPMIRNFDAQALRHWAAGLGVDTFVGSSGRVFPRDMKAAPLLRAWLHRLRELGVRIHPRHRWLGWSDGGHLRVQTVEGECQIQADAILLALGGASWQRLGSDGAWVSLLRERRIRVNTLLPANCGFETCWSDYMRDHHAGSPLHTCEFAAVSQQGKCHRVRGEAIVSAYGIEGSAIYALSAHLREQLQANGNADLFIDILPDLALEQIQQQLQKPRGKNSLSNFLRKQLHLSPVKIALLRERTTPDVWRDPVQLASAAKQLHVSLHATRPLDEAISSAGGVARESLTDTLMLHQCPGVFCAGEMLDWEAPTGGYLLTACLATGRQAGLGIIQYLASHP
ncbi:TIGR03862 family flavoprotein [Cellvibrio japonicus]|uniref:NAD(FAD)-utilizing dehydrogenase n=1 Tax=Cellvibrio japonicus (strain Ueda107) TaxID=498211 RepID=B3PDW0_CELJU|nr:TIGR03862 family flavoprotein [Cellvibrio japonicus]ACE85642.1 NAD(FAD)-utilizing dehydrogenase [Cellvibrio japonicus Ueda107]QEI13445.1 TIGR03862 family flavoprotein [Cellvibrio japonicus]QEI17019.1 TIGR03862 family flavoprotein [Cellvibrio japonicus]QEI20597.1 TIGR03862 family flavoprotein [Cellvibrio japonicus]